jgi:hypothetical protein
MNSCEKCGSLVPAEKAFCPNCGAAMTPERQRVPEDSGEMGETIYDGPPPKQPVPKPVPTPPSVNQATASTAPAKTNATTASQTQRPPDSRANNTQRAAPGNAPVAGNNNTLRMVLGAAAALFVISILVVAILYMMGKL